MLFLHVRLNISCQNVRRVINYNNNPRALLYAAWRAVKNPGHRLERPKWLSHVQECLLPSRQSRSTFRYRNQSPHRPRPHNTFNFLLQPPISIITAMTEILIVGKLCAGVWCLGRKLISIEFNDGVPPPIRARTDWAVRKNRNDAVPRMFRVFTGVRAKLYGFQQINAGNRRGWVMSQSFLDGSTCEMDFFEISRGTCSVEKWNWENCAAGVHHRSEKWNIR